MIEDVIRNIKPASLWILRFPILLIILFYSSSGQQRTTYGSLIGHISNAATHESITGAGIVILGSTLGASSDTSGNYAVIKVPAGTYEVRASAVGFAPAIKRGIVISESNQTKLIFSLDEQYVQMDEMITTGVQPVELPELPVSVRTLSYKEIQNTAGGFDDIIRTTTIMPGVMQTRLDRNDLYVRGGAPSENLFLVDGIEISNINHFGTQGSGGGSVSFINMDLIENTTFSSGGFGVNYGDRLSSVLSINLREGRSDKQREKVMISATEASVNLEGPLSEQGLVHFFCSPQFSRSVVPVVWFYIRPVLLGLYFKGELSNWKI